MVPRSFDGIEQNQIVPYFYDLCEVSQSGLFFKFVSFHKKQQQCEIKTATRQIKDSKNLRNNRQQIRTSNDGEREREDF